MNRRKFKKRRQFIKSLLTEEKRRGTEVDLNWAQLHMDILSGDLKPPRGQLKKRR